jgi:hypothetical protein
MELRTRDLGEIFDRAVALYGQNFLALIALVAVVTIPLALLQYPIAQIEQPQLDAMLRLIEHPELARTQPLPPLFASPRFLAATVSAALAGYLVWAFSLSAIAVGVERVYTGARIGFVACWSPVLRRCLAIAAVLGLALLALIVCDLVVIAVVLAVVSFVIALAPPLLPVVAPAAIVLALIVATVAPALVMMPCVLGFYAVAIESAGPIAAARLSLARIFTRGEFGRSLVCATVVSAIVFGASFLVESLAILGSGWWSAVHVALDAAMRTSVVPFVGIVLALYYFDVRIRREGFDIENGLARMPFAGEPVYAPTAYLSGEERILIARFLERRAELSPRYRGALAAQLAVPVRPRVPPDLQRLDDESLLERL